MTGVNALFDDDRIYRKFKSTSGDFGTSLQSNSYAVWSAINIFKFTFTAKKEVMFKNIQ